MGIHKGTDDWYQFFDLAAAERGKIPKDILTNKKVVEKLPILFRTLRGEKGLDDMFDSLIGHVTIDPVKHRRVRIPKKEISEFCRRNHIRRLALFGSVLRDDFRPDSDVDVLVEFDARASAGFLSLAAMELELSRIMGRRVHMRTPAELSPYFRDEVVRTARVEYVAA